MTNGYPSAARAPSMSVKRRSSNNLGRYVHVTVGIPPFPRLRFRPVVILTPWRPERKRLAHSPSVTEVKPPPMWIVRLNVAMLRRGLKIGSQHLLSVRGRKSGEVRSTPISIATIDGSRYIVAAFQRRLGCITCARRDQAHSGTGGTSNAFVSSSCRSRSAPRFCELSFSRSGAASASSGQAILM